MRAWLYLLAGLGMILPIMALAVPVTPTTELDPAIQRRFQTMIAELRCLVCQNQSLAESDSGLAADLRREVLEMMQQGQTDKQIQVFLVDRYGDFILYRPPFTAITGLLWLGPFLLLAGAFWYLRKTVKQRAKAGEKNLDGTEVKRLKQLLERVTQQKNRKENNQ